MLFYLVFCAPVDYQESNIFLTQNIARTSKQYVCKELIQIKVHLVISFIAV